MEGTALKARRVELGMTLSEAAAIWGCGRRSLARYEKAATVPDEVARAAMEGAPADPKAAAEKIAARVASVPAIADKRHPRPYDFKTAPAFCAGLRHLPASNVLFKADPAWDRRPCGEGWQRVPGACSVVHGDIPDPLPFQAPAWAGPLGIMSANGGAYHAHAGHRLRDPHRVERQGTVRTMGTATPKAEKRKARR